MKDLSYEHRVALFLSICIIAVVALAVMFVLRQRSVIANASLDVQTPNVDLSEWQNAMEAFQSTQE